MITGEPRNLHTTITHQIARRFFLRWHMAAILACVLLSGVVCSALLLRLGLRSMHWRYVLAVLGSYVLFFALIRLWLLYISIVEGTTGAMRKTSEADSPGGRARAVRGSIPAAAASAARGRARALTLRRPARAEDRAEGRGARAPEAVGV